ncbi:hypothetical protein [Roseateles sp. LYH14W]|uniref:Uncharacterized protein n=1 Tax=Pelomonas parva TaxID=3299032 RepID=A0ABW7FBF6_9BURK
MLPSLDPLLHSPERLPFIKKLRCLLEDHGFEDTPTLVIQCAADDTEVANLDSGEVNQALLKGCNGYNGAEWWSGFMAGRTSKVFDGVSSVDSRSEPNWVTELHQDGHFLAAVRLMVYADLAGVHPAIVNAFTQFGELLKNLHTAAAVQARLTLTATLVNTRDVGVLLFPQYGQPQVRHLKRDSFEWPVYRADSAEDVKGICEQMGAKMSRLFPGYK